MSQALNGREHFVRAKIAFLAQRKAGFLCLEAGGLLADMVKWDFTGQRSVVDCKQSWKEAGASFTEWVFSVPVCEVL